MKRFFLVFAIGGALLGAAFASAAALNVNSGSLQAGTAELACDTSGVNVTNYSAELDGLTFNSLWVRDIDADCEGARVIVRIYDEVGGTNAICSNSNTQNATLVPLGGGDVQVTLNSACSVVAAEEIRVLIQH
jgi:hypothetical protein